MMKKTLLKTCLVLTAGLGFAQEKATMIVPPNAPMQKEFGNSISMTHNNHMVIGAEFEEAQGAVYIYQNNDFKKKIAARNFDEDASNFGSQSVISQNWLAVGAPGSNGAAGYGVGKIYFFFDQTYNSNFADEPTFVLEGAAQNDRLGREFKMENGWLIAKTYTSGKLYVYQATGWGSNSQWVLKSVVTAPNNTGISSFDMSGNTLVFTTLGDYWEGTNGDMFVYERDWNGTYTERYRRSNDGMPSWATYRYGTKVAVSGGTILVTDENANSVEVLIGGGNYYGQKDVLSLPNTYVFGERLAVKNNRALISFIRPDNKRYIGMYTRSGNSFQYLNDFDYSNTKIDNQSAQHKITLGENDMVAMAIKDSPFPGVYGNDRGVAYIGSFSSLTKSLTDSYEGNNSAYEATNLQVDMTYKSYINSTSDADFFQVNWAGGPLEFVLTDVQATTRFDLVDANGSVLESRTIYSAGGTATISGTYSAGTVKVKVSGSVGAYALTATSLHCDTYSGEPNNTSETAIEFFSNSGYGRDLYGAILTSTDEDWYKINKTEDNSYNRNLLISLMNVAKDFDIHLYNEYNQEIARSWRGGTSDEQIFVEDLAVGTYYLKVRGWAGNNSPDCYTLNVNLTSNAASRIASDDEVNAKEFTAEGSDLTIMPNPALSGDVVTISTADDVETETVSIYDLGGRVIETLSVSASGNQAKFNLPTLEAGVYLIRSSTGQARLVVE